jgi:hypothetical protein
MYRQRRLPEALERFLASNRLVPNPNVTFNIAQIYGLMDRPIDAYNWYEQDLAFALSDEDRRAATRARDALAPRVAVVSVATDPSGADLFVDRVDLGSVGKSPRRIAVAPGTHEIVARLEGHREGRASVAAGRGQVVDAAPRLEALVGRVHVDSDPPGATVTIEGRGESLGTTPVDLTLPLGETRLVLDVAGYGTETRAVPVREGETARLSVTMTRGAGSSSTLTVRAEPAGAEVLLDGRPIGRTPLTQSGFLPGTKRILVRAPGREAWSSDLLLEAGAATRVRATLVDPAERAWPGWYWLGLGGGGALFAAGAVTGGFALAEHAAFDQEPSRDRYDTLATLNVAADVLMAGGLAIAAGTLVIDWVSGPPLESGGRVSVDR